MTFGYSEDSGGNKSSKRAGMFIITAIIVLFGGVVIGISPFWELHNKTLIEAMFFGLITAYLGSLGANVGEWFSKKIKGNNNEQ